MAHLLANYPTGIWKLIHTAEASQRYRNTKHGGIGVVVACYGIWRRRASPKKGRLITRPYLKCKKQSSGVKCFCSPTEELRLVDQKVEEVKEKLDYLVSEYGWKVRRLVEEAGEMKKAAFIQAEAFHVPVALFNDYFYQFFQAEVLSGLVYKLKNSPPNRYACLVAETSTSRKELVGIVDVTALRDKDVLQHLQGAEEYLYISGLAVLQRFRRQKIGTVLLRACDTLSIQWGFRYLVLRAYDDDLAALKLYTNAGYRIVSGDPPWFSTWIGRKRRVLMIKRSDYS